MRRKRAKKMRKNWRKGRKGKGKKGKKGPFDYDKFMDKIDEKEGKMGDKIEKKCNRKRKMYEIGKKMMEEDQEKYGEYLETADGYINAEFEKCKDNSKCKVIAKTSKARCMAKYRYMMASMWKDDMPAREDITKRSVGACWVGALTKVEVCKAAAERNLEENMDGVNDIPDDVKKELMQGIKKKVKGRIQKKMRKRRGKGKGKGKRRYK